MAEHIVNLQLLKEGDENPHIQQINQQLGLLVKGHNDLATAYNKNWQNFSQSIQMLDTRVGALMLVLDDIARGGIEEVTKLDAEALGLHAGAEHPQIGGVHWPGYIHTYLKKVEAELEELRRQGEAAQTVAFDPLITPPQIEEDEADVVFGGKDNSDGEAQLETGAPG